MGDFMRIYALIIFLQFFNVAYADTDFSITSWNLGLAYDYVPMAEQRRTPVLEKLKKVDTDVLCVQELWTDSDVSLFNEELKSSYPHSYTISNKQRFASKLPACRPYELFGPKSVGMCILRKCIKKKGDHLTDCVLNTCGEAVARLKNKNRVCAEALFAQVGKKLLKGILKVLSVFSRVGMFSYEGSTGLAVYSKYPLEEVTELDMSDISTLTRRAGIYAKVNVNGRNRHIVCTHLTAAYKNIPYTGVYDSWVEESEMQAKQIAAFSVLIAGDEPLYLAGDFNCSLGYPEYDLVQEAPKTCQAVINEGFYDSMKKNPECTFCSDNTLMDGPHQKGRVIDHIFVKNVDLEGLTLKVDMKELVTIEDNDGQAVKSNLSDHYGLSLETID